RPSASLEITGVEKRSGAILEEDLRGAEDVARREKGESRRPALEGFAGEKVARGSAPFRTALSVEGDRLRRGPHFSEPGDGVIRMRVGEDRSGDGLVRVNEGVERRGVEPFGAELEEGRKGVVGHGGAMVAALTVGRPSPHPSPAGRGGGEGEDATRLRGRGRRGGGSLRCGGR